VQVSVQYLMLGHVPSCSMLQATGCALDSCVL